VRLNSASRYDISVQYRVSRSGCVRGAVVLVALLSAYTPTSLASPNSGASSDYARQVSTVSLRMAELEQLLVDGEQRIEQLEEVIRLQGKSEASRLENLDEVNTEVARLRGEIEVLTFRLGEIESAVEKDQISRERRLLHTESRLRQLEKFLGVTPPPPPTDVELGLVGDGSQESPEDMASDAVPGDEVPAEESLEVPDTAIGKLDLAAEHMRAGRQGVARAVLQKAIDDHGSAEEIAEIRYRFAETYINDQDWRNAILQFQKVIDNHPDSDWTCWAHLRQGEAMESLQGPQHARPFYAGASQGKCKNSEAAKAAKKKQ
jgi:TolA-binding protein